jgi:5-oxoprolinase (ATP-hydrolysing)
LEHDTDIQTFVDCHQEEFGFTLERKLPVDNIRVPALKKSSWVNNMTVSEAVAKVGISAATGKKAVKRTKLFTSGEWRDVLLFEVEALSPGDKVSGPAIILDQTQTILVQPSWAAIVYLTTSF